MSQFTRRFVSLALLALSPLLVPAQTPAQTDLPRVRISTNQGDIMLELNAKAAPQTVANFLQYVRDKHYDGTIFHRVIDGFMIQGGGYDSQYRERTTRAPIAHEGRQALERGGPRNTPGTVAMARTNNPNSATAQFFINVKDNAFLDPSVQAFGYTAFGQVVAGMDVVNKIKSIPTGSGGPFRSDVPLTPVIIQSATVITP
ncbi:MAG: peptidylprolyl isomerase [Alphaproteobacteria bacterium]|nr:peptidylprolyl isomerase [Alphaproteobacteria bacterium]